MGLLLLLLQTADLGGEAFFEKKVRPVLAEHCLSCHSRASGKSKGGLVLDSREAVLRGGDSGPSILPGEPDRSLLLKAVRYELEEAQMPPKGRLPAESTAALAEWIRRGAPWPEEAPPAAVRSPTADAPAAPHWSFQPLRRSPDSDRIDSLAPAGAKESIRTQPGQASIDGFLDAALGRIRPAPPADPATLLRRVTFDLTGLPPAPEEIEAFLGDTSPEAFEKVVDRLLASPRFGERWGRHWLDVVRYADSNGGGADYTLDEAWRYRDYVIAAFNADKPYDRFLREQLAGDQLEEGDRVENLIATGFLVVGPKELAEYDKEKLRMDVVDEQLDTIGQAFLGLTLGCARCHDHKFDAITTADYYGLAGILRSTVTIPAANIGGPISGWNKRLLEPTPENVAALKAWKKEVGAARSRAVQARERKAPAEERERLEREAARLLLKTRPEEAIAVQDEARPSDLRIHVRGDVHNLGAGVPRGFPRAIGVADVPAIDPRRSGRRELAEWITRPDHPLTARVMVNRLWHHLFGAGLVRTVDNFGTRGEPPSHSQLLDVLAVRFVEKGWSVKSMIREIVTSRAYRRSSRHDPAAAAADPENRLLWRQNRRRLDAEAIRDAMLAVAGRLDLRMGGSTNTAYGRLWTPSEQSNLPVDPWRRRAVYLPRYRGAVPPDVLEVFDAAPTNLVSGRRAVTVVPSQALFLLNSPFVAEQARHAAEGASARRLYLAILGRPPVEAERRRARGAEPALLAHALFSSNAFLFLD